jgi:phosphoglycolate phosphatase
MRIWFGNSLLECDAIGFDKDGTLVDRMALWQGLYEARRPILEARLNERTFDFWHSVCGVDPESGEIDLDGPLAMGSRAEEIHVLALAIYRGSGTPWAQAVSSARDLLAAADDLLPERSYATPLNGVPHVLVDLADAGLPLAIVTSDHEWRARRSSELLGFDQAIACIVTPEHVSHGKPAPDMVFLAAQTMGVEPERMAVVGDSIVDMQMAQAAGAIPVALIDDQLDPKMVSLSAASLHSISEIHIERG